MPSIPWTGAPSEPEMYNITHMDELCHSSTHNTVHLLVVLHHALVT